MTFRGATALPNMSRTINEVGMNSNLCSIRPGMTRPSAVPATELGTGALWRRAIREDRSTPGPNDGWALRAALDAVFADVGASLSVPPVVKPRT